MWFGHTNAWTGLGFENNWQNTDEYKPVSSTYLRYIWEDHVTLTYISIQIVKISIAITIVIAIAIAISFAISFGSLALLITRLLNSICHISIFVLYWLKLHTRL